MNPRHAALSIACAVLAPAPAFAGYVEPQIAQRSLQVPHKAVYHFNTGDGKLLLTLLGNIQNHLKAADGQADIHLVIHNDAVFQLQNPPAEAQKRLDDLRGRNVTLSVCNTSLKGRDIDWHSLYGVREADIVRSGVAEVVDLQMRGYAYIKP